MQRAPFSLAENDQMSEKTIGINSCWDRSIAIVREWKIAENSFASSVKPSPIIQIVAAFYEAITLCRCVCVCVSLLNPIEYVSLSHSLYITAE